MLIVHVVGAVIWENIGNLRISSEMDASRMFKLSGIPLGYGIKFGVADSEILSNGRCNAKKMNTKWF